MSKTEDIAKLDRSIKDADIRVNTILANVEAFNKEISILNGKAKEIEENLTCLKKNRVIAVAQEFKKAKDELKAINNKIIALRNDKEHLLKNIEDMRNFIKKTQTELDKLQNANDNNVLQFSKR